MSIETEISETKSSIRTEQMKHIALYAVVVALILALILS